jgi:hypothetical protein
VAAALFVYLAAAAWLVWRTAILEPYSDMFDWLDRYFRWRTDHDLLSYLWAPHNIHHLVWTFLVLAGDIGLFGASSGLFLAVGTGCLAVTAAMFAWTAAKAASSGFRLIAAGGAVAVAAMGCHVLDASADINTTYLHALVFAAAAILLAERRPRGWAAAALACALAAGLGNAAGLAVWPALLAGALRRRDWRWSLAVAAAGLAFGVLYLAGEPAALAGTMSTGRAGAMARLFLTYLGLPWSRGLGGLGWALGAVVLAGGCWATWIAGARDAPWPRRAAAGWILFSLATAGLVAAGRAGATPPDQPAVRYAVLLTPLQAGLWISVLPAIERAWARRPRAGAAGLVAASAFLLLHQALMVDYALRTSDGIRQALDDFHAGRRTPAMLTRVHPDLEKATSVSAQLRRAGLYQREMRP